MGRTRIQPLILFSLAISAVTMILFAYANLDAGHSGYGFVFVALAAALIIMVIYGLVTNRKLANRK